MLGDLSSRTDFFDRVRRVVNGRGRCRRRGGILVASDIRAALRGVRFHLLRDRNRLVHVLGNRNGDSHICGVSATARSAVLDCSGEARWTLLLAWHRSRRVRCRLGVGDGMGSRDGGVARRADVYVCSRVSCRYIGRGVGLRVDRSCRGRYRVEGNIDGIAINRVTGVFDGRAIGGMSRGTNGRALNRVRRVFDRRALSRMTGIFSRGRRALNRIGRPGRRRGGVKRAT
jgi:hypothetical protein